MGLNHTDHTFGTILDVYVEVGSTRTGDVIDNSGPSDRIRKLCGSSHITPKFVTVMLSIAFLAGRGMPSLIAMLLMYMYFIGVI